MVILAANKESYTAILTKSSFIRIVNNIIEEGRQ